MRAHTANALNLETGDEGWGDFVKPLKIWRLESVDVGYRPLALLATGPRLRRMGDIGAARGRRSSCTREGL